VATPEQLEMRVRLDVGKVNGFEAAFASRPSPDSKLFYDRNRAEGQGHNAAIICPLRFVSEGPAFTRSIRSAIRRRAAGHRR
jgi:hypothetical protein